MPIKGSIAADLERQRAGLDAFLHNEAEHAGDLVADRVAAHTPVGRRIDPVTGHDLGPSGALKADTHALPVTGSRGTYRTGAAQDLDYASDVEYGTRAHIISGTPLRFWNHGQLIFARHVSHPSVPGHHMFAIGLAEADQRFAQESERRLQEFLRG